MFSIDGYGESLGPLNSLEEPRKTATMARISNSIPSASANYVFVMFRTHLDRYKLLQFLSQHFQNTLSLSPEKRRAAEAKLAELSEQPNFAFAVLNLVAIDNADEAIRHAASVNFKNHLRSHWSPSPDSPASPIPGPEKQQIKASIVSLMLTSPPRIQSQLSEALTLIGAQDFPKQWPTLLPELVASLEVKMRANDHVAINGILRTANSIFKKFRYQYKTNELLLDLKHCLDEFAKPLLCVFQHTAGLIDSAAAAGAAANVDTLKLLFESQRLCCRVFYSLNFQELPEFFEDHMREWMTEFQKYLTASYPAVEGVPNGLALVDDVRAAVCDNISLYMEKNEEEFREFLEGFMLAVWTLLLSVSPSSSRDRLAVTAMKFLTTVSTSVHHTLLGSDGVIPQICQGIVIPNVRLREEDEELFEMNYIEFIRRDMEGSDLDTRRRIACELLKGIATNFRQQLTGMVSVEIQNLLMSFAANPVANWKDKDCAIYLVVSLAMKKAGSASVSTDHVDIENFFATAIIPELQSQDINAFPMLKAGALKFFNTFRSLLPKPFVVTLFPNLVRFLAAESNVVHSYAATCVEKLLLVKDEGGRARYNSSDLAPFLATLMNNLFSALKLPESEENQYVMKSIMRVIGVAEITTEVAGFCISGLTSVLVEVCKNPKNPIFNHYLFESIAGLVRRACERDSSLVSAFENSLFPSIQTILANDITEFLPYAFQLLAQLVELSKPPMAPSYMQIFTLLLSPESWKRNSNVPALVRLLQAFLQKAPQEVIQEGRLSQVLEIFYKLVSVSSTDEQGFYVLNTVIEYLDYGAIAPFIAHIWSALFYRLQDKCTGRFVKSFIIFMSLFSIKHGTSNLIKTMNAVQANIFFAILEQFWIPNLKLITGHVEVKLAAVAATRLICECPALLDPAAVRHGGKMLDSIITLLSQPEERRVEEEPDVPDIAETVGYTVSFASLYNAGKKEVDPLKDIADPKEFLVASLVRVSAGSPGRYPQIIGEYVDPANQSALLELCRAHNCSIV